MNAHCERINRISHRISVGFNSNTSPSPPPFPLHVKCVYFPSLPPPLPIFLICDITLFPVPYENCQALQYSYIDWLTYHHFLGQANSQRGISNLSIPFRIKNACCYELGYKGKHDELCFKSNWI